MKIEIIQSDKSVLRLAFSGKLDANTVANGSMEFFSLLNHRKSPVYLDFSEVVFLSSLGIRMLLVAFKEVKEQGHDLKIENVRPEIAKIISTAGLDFLIN
ncbi:MAG: STAS domain-containing protein [Bacteroidota bacterium]